MTDLDARRRRRRSERWLPVLVALVVAGLSAGVLLAAAPGRQHRAHKTTAARAPGLDYDVAWVRLPDPPGEPSPMVSATPLPTSAPACSAAQVHVDPASVMSDQITQDDGVVIGIRNSSSRPCLLADAPDVQLTGGGMPAYRVPSTHRLPYDGAVTADMAPGQETEVLITSPRACADNGNGAGTAPRYDHVLFTMPGGGTVVVDARLHAACGTSTSDYFVNPPAPAPSADPWYSITASITLPATATAGERMDYVVTLRNPSDSDLELVPVCPGYVESARAGVPMKEIYGLNCAGAGALPAHGRLRFQMRLHVSEQAEPGPMTVYWTLLTVGGTAHATGTVIVTAPNHP